MVPDSAKLPYSLELCMHEGVHNHESHLASLFTSSYQTGMEAGHVY